MQARVAHEWDSAPTNVTSVYLFYTLIRPVLHTCKTPCVLKGTNTNATPLIYRRQSGFKRGLFLVHNV